MLKKSNPAPGIPAPKHLAGRWGGEEFLILLPHQKIDQVRSVAEKLRSVIETTVFDEVNSITASFGVAEYNAEETVAGLKNLLTCLRLHTLSSSIV